MSEEIKAEREDKAEKKARKDAYNSRKRSLTAENLTNFIPVLACVVLAILYFSFAFAQGINLKIGIRVIISNATLVGLVATGATFIFTSGSFDLSLGANMLVSALVGGLVGKATGSLLMLILTCLCVAILLSLLNSVLASLFNLPVFIMTIVMMNVYGSISKLIIGQFGENSQVAIPQTLVSSLNNTVFRILLLLGFEILCCYLFYFTSLGRKQKFLGGNPTCAHLSGINPKKLTVLSFALTGIGIGLAAIAMTVETPTLSQTSGSGVGMNMLIALVFGGMTMSGGPRSKMYSAILGAFSMAFLDSFMNIFVSGSWYLQIVKGILFVAVVFMFSFSHRSELLER